MNESRQEIARRGVRAVDTCRIRQIGWQDWKQLAVLFRRIFPELTNDQISHYICGHEDTIAVAEARDGLVGFYHFIPRVREATAWLNYIGVLPAYCRSGIGAQLLRDYEERAAGMGFRRAELDVLRENRNAIRFYEKHGYVRLPLPGDKYRYRKILAADDRAVARPGPQPKRARLQRLGRRLLYLVLVSLPRMLGDL